MRVFEGDGWPGSGLGEGWGSGIRGCVCGMAVGWWCVSVNKGWVWWGGSRVGLVQWGDMVLGWMRGGDGVGVGGNGVGSWLEGEWTGRWKREKEWDRHEGGWDE